MRRFIVHLLGFTLAASVVIAAATPGSADPASTRVKLIVGGNYTEIENHPYQVALLYAAESSAFYGQFCGGSSIDQMWVLTAAHCVDDRGPNEVLVGAGKTRLTDMTQSDRYPVDAIYVHPSWDGNTSRGHDVALLQLSWPIPTSVAEPIALLDDPGLPLDGTPIIQSGWGSTSHILDGAFPDRLRAVTVDVAGSPGHYFCGYDPWFESTTRICAEGPERNGNCAGDSGGPNIITIDGIRYLAGISSYVLASEGFCANPNVHTRVSTYVEWIRSKIGTPLPETLAKSIGMVPLARAQFDACPPSAAIPPVGFSDTDSIDVDCIAYYGITRGTTETTYSPNDPVTRWQMALYLTRAAGPAGISLGAGADGGFADISDKSSEIQVAINQIKELGVTLGTTATTYSPDDNVTREQMAMFIERFLSVSTAGPGGVTDWFEDNDSQRVAGVGVARASTDLSLATFNYTDADSGTTYEGRNAIAHLWHMGVTSDENSTAHKYSTQYRPSSAMSRAEMANFIASALDHTNARPKGVTIQAALYDSAGETPVSWAGTTRPELSVSFRADDFTPSVGVPIDVFYYEVPTDGEGTAESTAIGLCGSAPGGPIAATNAWTGCYIDSNESSTDTTGNTMPMVPPVPGGKTWNLYAWTAAPHTAYDRDIHSADTSSIEVTASDDVQETGMDYSYAILNDLALFSGLDLSGSDFTGAQLDEGFFIHSTLIDTDFSNARGLGTSFASAEVSGSDFTGSQFRGSNFDSADLHGTNFTGAQIIQSTFIAADLTEANLTNAQAGYTNFTEAILHRADLTGAILNNALLTRAVLVDGTLTNADLDYAALDYANLRGADLRGVSARYATIVQGYLNDADLSGADLSGVNFDRSTLISANLTGVILTNVNLEWSNMQNVNLSGADLTGADLTGAKLTNAKADLSTRWPDGFDPEAAGAVIG